MKKWHLALAVAICLVSSASTRAGKLDSTISLGQSTRFWSETLQEERRVFVYLPRYYDVSGRRYPVLYLLDAEEQYYHAVSTAQFLADNDRVPEMIIIGITNSHRTRDLTPLTSDKAILQVTPDAGGPACSWNSCLMS